jgi:hypothetical protein
MKKIMVTLIAIGIAIVLALITVMHENKKDFLKSRAVIIGMDWIAF